MEELENCISPNALPVCRFCDAFASPRIENRWTTDDVEALAAGFPFLALVDVCSCWAVQKSMVYVLVCGKWRISLELCTVLVGLDAKA